MVTTISVAGIPLDVSEAQFNNWFIFAPGFERAAIATVGNTAKGGLARFRTSEAACDAIHTLDGKRVVTDEQSAGSFLTAALAKQDLPPAQFAQVAPSRKRPLADAMPVSFAELVPPGAPQEWSPANSLTPKAPNLATDLATAWKEIFKNRSPLPDLALEPPTVEVQSQPLPQHTAQGGTPVDTLLIHGISANVSKDEVNVALSNFPGLVDMNYGSDGFGKVKAAARFDSIESCANAVEVLRSSAFPSAPSDPIPVDFASLGDPFASFGGIGGNAPCNILVISDLPNCYPESDITEFVKKGCQGLDWVKLVQMGAGAMAWIKFTTVDKATSALLLMTVGGYTLPNMTTMLNVDYADSELASQIGGTVASSEVPVQALPDLFPAFAQQHLANQSTANSSQWPTENLQVEQRFVARVLGKGGSVCHEIEAQTGTQILVNQATKQMGYSTIHISGPMEAVSAAKVLICEKLNKWGAMLL